MTKIFINNINDKKVIPIDNEISDIVIYASKKNIEKIKLNQKKEIYNNTINYYENTINNLENKINNLENKIDDYETKLDDYEEKNSELNVQIEEYKSILKSSENE